MAQSTPHTVGVIALADRRVPRPLPAALVLVLLGLGVLAGCTGGKDAVDQNANRQFRYVSPNQKGSLIAVAKRKPAGPVAGPLISGGSYQLSQDRGEVVVLNFFASWCGPCQNETPQFDSVYRARKSSGIRFVGLDVKDPSKSGSRAWLAAKQISYPVVYDEPARTALQLGNVPLAGLPATVLIDRQGRVAAVYVQPLLPKDLQPVLDQLASETQ